MNSLSEGLKELKLKAFAKHYEKMAQKCESSNQAFIEYLVSTQKVLVMEEIVYSSIY